MLLQECVNSGISDVPRFRIVVAVRERVGSKNVVWGLWLVSGVVVILFEWWSVPTCRAFGW